VSEVVTNEFGKEVARRSWPTFPASAEQSERPGIGQSVWILDYGLHYARNRIRLQAGARDFPFSIDPYRLGDSPSLLSSR
jgi:hypothetical protein